MGTAGSFRTQNLFPKDRGCNILYDHTLTNAWNDPEFKNLHEALRVSVGQPWEYLPTRVSSNFFFLFFCSYNKRNTLVTSCCTSPILPSSPFLLVFFLLFSVLGIEHRALHMLNPLFQQNRNDKFTFTFGII